MTQLKQTSDRKIAEKDEELENGRKNHLRQLESLQATIDNELRTKGELQKGRKKFESDMLELEANLDVSNRNNIEYQKTVKKLQSQVKVHIFSFIYRCLSFSFQFFAQDKAKLFLRFSQGRKIKCAMRICRGFLTNARTFYLK